MATNTEKIVVQVVVKGQKQLEDLSGKTSKATKGVGGLTKGFAGMAAGVLGAVAAFRQINRMIGSAIRTFRDFEFQMSKVKAITGASTGDFLKLSKTAEDLGRTTFFTAQQVAELQTNFGKLGFTTKEILDAQSATLDLATATGSDLARAATVAGASVRGFGLDASETQRVVDVMAVAFTSSAMDIEKWQTGMTKVAPIAKSAGFSIEDTAAMMSKLTDAGIEASIAGTSMRNILLAMQDPNSKLVKSFGKTIHSYDELVPAMNKFVAEGGRMKDVMKVVEKRQAAAFEQLISNTGATLELRDALVDSGGAAKIMADIVGDNLEGAFKRLNSAWEGLMINFTESVVGKGLQNFVDGVANLVNVVSDFVDIPMSEKLEEERKQMNLLFEVLKDTTVSQDTRNKAINKLNLEYNDYLPNLITEKNTVKELSEHQFNANKQMAEKIRMMGAEERLLEIQKEGQKIAAEEFDVQMRLAENRQKVADGEQEILTTMEGQVDLTSLQIMKDELRLKKLQEEGVVFQQEYDDALKVAEQFGIQLEGNNEVVSENTNINNNNTESIKANTDAVKENALEKTFVADATREYWIALMNDVLDGNQTMAVAEQELFDFQVELLNNLLLDESLAYDERMKLEEQLANLKLKNRKEDEDSLSNQIKGMQEIGNQLIYIAGEEKGLQEIKKVGIRISQAAGVAAGFEAMQKASLAIADTAADSPWFLKVINVLALLAAMASTMSNMRALMKPIADSRMERGGMVQGKSHAQGGEKFAVGGRVVELEGGEAVINKRSTSMFRGQLSAMNAAGGGVKFADGGLLNQPSFSQQQFNALNQNQMVGAMGSSRKVVVVESDITDTQEAVSVIQSQATL